MSSVLHRSCVSRVLHHNVVSVVYCIVKLIVKVEDVCAALHWDVQSSVRVACRLCTLQYYVRCNVQLSVDVEDLCSVDSFAGNQWR